MHIPLQGIVALDPDDADGSSITAKSPLASETAMGSVDGHRVLGLATGQNGIGTIWMRSGRTACTSSCTKTHSLSR